MPGYFENGCSKIFGRRPVEFVNNPNTGGKK
jgi:hypothetical protein